jgi:hypothetical protein
MSRLHRTENPPDVAVWALHRRRCGCGRAGRNGSARSGSYHCASTARRHPCGEQVTVDATIVDTEPAELFVLAGYL